MARNGDEDDGGGGKKRKGKKARREKEREEDEMRLNKVGPYRIGLALRYNGKTMHAALLACRSPVVLSRD